MSRKKLLFTPAFIGKLEIKNRIVMTAMDTGMSNFDGTPTELLKDYYLQRVRGGVGLIITGICRVNNIHGVAEPRQNSLARRRNLRKFRPFIQEIHREGGAIMVQLHHPGRQNYPSLIGVWPLVELFSRIPGFAKIFPQLVKLLSSLEKRIWAPAVVAPSAIPCGHLQEKTRALRRGEIQRLVKQFIEAAARAQKAGFDGVELHGAHGYLIQQFLSPYSNHRTDIYGGNYTNRLRFLREIIEGIKSRCGKDFPIVVRLTVDEFIPKEYTDPSLSPEQASGITLNLGKAIAKSLEELGVDGLNISSGSYEQTNRWLETVNYELGWRKYLAESIKREVTIPIIAANLIRSGEQAEEQLAQGVQDFIGLGRPLLADPELPNKIQRNEEESVHRCIICCTCFESLLKNAWVGKPLRCAVNPRVNRVEEKSQNTPPQSTPKQNSSIVVVGGGIAGMQAALEASKKGHRVVLFEKSDSLGGQVKLANKAPHKEKLGWIVEDLHYHLLHHGVAINLNTPATIEKIVQEHPSTVLLATGATPIMPKIPGRELPQVYSFAEILSGERNIEGSPGSKVAIIGSGLTGLETAEYLQAEGYSVVVVEMAEVLAPGAHYQHREESLRILQEGGAEFFTSHRLISIGVGRIALEAVKTASRVVLSVDSVVLALGSRSDNRLLHTLETLPSRSFSIETIGDASAIGRIADATEAGYTAIGLLKG